jgi:hypothetical protein
VIIIPVYPFFIVIVNSASIISCLCTHVSALRSLHKHAAQRACANALNGRNVRMPAICACKQGWDEAAKEVQVLRDALALTRFVLGDKVRLFLYASRRGSVL